MRTGVWVALFGATLLAGCAAPVHPVPTTVETPGMPNPETALQKSMNDVNAEMAELGELTPAAATPITTPVMPGPLQKTVSFSWNGSLDQGVAKLA